MHKQKPNFRSLSTKSRRTEREKERGTDIMDHFVDEGEQVQHEIQRMRVEKQKIAQMIADLEEESRRRDREIARLRERRERADAAMENVRKTRSARFVPGTLYPPEYKGFTWEYMGEFDPPKQQRASRKKKSPQPEPVKRFGQDDDWPMPEIKKKKSYHHC